jgi:hypothetical protein
MMGMYSYVDLKRAWSSFSRDLMLLMYTPPLWSAHALIAVAPSGASYKGGSSHTSHRTKDI